MTAPRRFEPRVDLERFDGSSLALMAMRCSETLSAPHELSFAATVAEPFDPAELLGQAVSVILTLGDEAGDERAFHGFVFDARLRTIRDELYRLEVTARARMAVLGLGRASRIFQDESVRDIVSAILDEAGLSDGYRWEAGADPPRRPYVVQRQESDLAFVTRLLADEGIGFAVRNGPDADEVVFFGDSTTLPSIDGVAALVDARATRLDTDVVLGARDELRATSDQAMLRDYDFMNPSRDLSTRAAGDGSAGREVYVHAGGFLDPGAGQRRADRVLEALAQERRLVSGRSDCPRLEPGRRFTLLEHDHGESNTELLLRSVVHELQFHAHAHSEAERPVTYLNSFVAQPADVPWRPAPPARRPHRGGVENAFVTGPSGSEIDSDRWGRVTVRFPWDRSGVTDDHSSTELRVGQYPLGGAMLVPRVGFEVLVDFEMGDVDRPMVGGHLYNGEARPPYELPGGATRSSFQTATTPGGGGTNELRFEDAAGAEEIFLDASRDYITAVANDAAVSVKAAETYDVGGDRTLSVGKDQSKTVAGDETLDVGGNQSTTVQGPLSVAVGGAMDVSIGNDRQLTVGGDLTEEVGASMTRDVGALQSITGIAGCDRKVVGDSKTTVSAAWAETIGGSRMVSVGASFDEKVAALKFIKAKSVGVSAGAAYSMTAAAESVTAGGARTDAAKGAVAITAGGGMKVKAKDIVITASSKLVVRGGAISIELTSGGSVSIKAPTVKVVNADVLSQVMHKSG